MHALRLAGLSLALVLVACGDEDELIDSEPADPTSDQSTAPPDVDTDAPVFDTDT